MTPAPQRRERKAQRTPTGNEETAPPTARRNRTAGGAERTHPSGRPRKGRPREPPAEERERQKRLATGGTAWGDRGRGTERGERRSESKPQRRTTAPDRAEGSGKAREGATGKGARDERLRSPCRETDEGASGATGRSGGWRHAAAAERARSQRSAAARRLAIKERGKKPRGGFLGRDRASARPNDSAHTEEVPRGRRRAVAVGHTRRRYRPQRGRLGGGQSAAAAVHGMSRTAQPLVQSLTGREPSPIINRGGSSASAGACQPVFPLGAVRRRPAPVRGL